MAGGKSSYQKVTLTIPTQLYKQAQSLVKKGVFSNISDVIRSGIRSQILEMRDVVNIHNLTKEEIDVLKEHRKKKRRKK